MQQNAAVATTSFGPGSGASTSGTEGLAGSSFAGFLASLADTPSRPREQASAWKDDGLADDIATLSYEQALRRQERYGARHRTPQADAAADGVSPVAAVTPDSSRSESEDEPLGGMSAPGKNVKRASITIRLSEAEGAQIRQRAAEAGLTVSAYLRSCTLEVENLRAQVKQTLAELRQATPLPRQTAPTAPEEPLDISPAHSWRRFWPFVRRGHAG